MAPSTATATLEAVADVTRRRILDELRNGERPVHALVDTLAMSQPAISKHLRVLRDAGLVEVRPEGPRRLYRVRPDPLFELDEWLEPYRAMWRRSLDRLERQLSEPDPDSGRPGSPRKEKRR